MELIEAAVLLQKTAAMYAEGDRAVFAFMAGRPHVTTVVVGDQRTTAALYFAARTLYADHLMHEVSSRQEHGETWARTMVALSHVIADV